MSVSVDSQYLSGFLGKSEWDAIAPQVKTAHDLLHSGTGLGNDFIGWLDLPENYDKEEFGRIKQAADKIKKDTDLFIVIGIGGSYLGARAAIEFLKSPNYNALKKDTPDIYFAGNSISSSALAELISLCEGKDISINMISKSGTTPEPAIAFRVLKDLLEKKYGKEEAKKRIYCFPLRFAARILTRSCKALPMPVNNMRTPTSFLTPAISMRLPATCSPAKANLWSCWSAMNPAMR